MVNQSVAHQSQIKASIMHTVWPRPTRVTEPMGHPSEESHPANVWFYFTNNSGKISIVYKINLGICIVSTSTRRWKHDIFNAYRKQAQRHAWNAVTIHCYFPETGSISKHFIAKQWFFYCLQGIIEVKRPLKTPNLAQIIVSLVWLNVLALPLWYDQLTLAQFSGLHIKEVTHFPVLSFLVCLNVNFNNTLHFKFLYFRLLSDLTLFKKISALSFVCEQLCKIMSRRTTNTIVKKLSTTIIAKVCEF